MKPNDSEDIGFCNINSTQLKGDRTQPLLKL